jgi:hypothetical protein
MNHGRLVEQLELADQARAMVAAISDEQWTALALSGDMTERWWRKRLRSAASEAPMLIITALNELLNRSAETPSA